VLLADSPAPPDLRHAAAGATVEPLSTRLNFAAAGV